MGLELWNGGAFRHACSGWQYAASDCTHGDWDLLFARLLGAGLGRGRHSITANDRRSTHTPCDRAHRAECPPAAARSSRQLRPNASSDPCCGRKQQDGLKQSSGHCQRGIRRVLAMGERERRSIQIGHRHSKPAAVTADDGRQLRDGLCRQSSNDSSRCTHCRRHGRRGADPPLAIIAPSKLTRDEAQRQPSRR